MINDGSRTVKFSDIVKFSDKQKLATAMADQHRFLLYGGAAGGGKSYWLRWYALRWLIRTFRSTGVEGLQAALFSEDYPTLKDRHVGKLEIEVPNWLGSLKEDKAYGLCVKLDPAFGGGVLLLRNLDDPSKYMSTEFALEAVDELTKNPPEVFHNLRARLRWPGLGDNTKFIAGTNPGGIGHEWVKKLWVDRVFPVEEQESDQFAYVPATADDNPHIDKSYLRGLESLPERMRKALREGDWNLVAGQFFTEFQKEQHIVPTTPFLQIPPNWKKFRSIDVSGRNGVTSCHWHALDTDGNLWTYREYFASGADSDEHAKNIWDLSHYKDDQDRLVAEEYKWTVMDSAAWAKMGMSETTAEVYLRTWEKLDQENFVSSSDSLNPASKEREMGWDIMHQYLRWDDDNKPKWRIMDCCKNLIRTIPLLMVDVDKNNIGNQNDVKDMPGTDDAADECRYMLMTLRDQRSPKSENAVERRIRERKEKAEQSQYNFNYSKKH